MGSQYPVKSAALNGNDNKLMSKPMFEALQPHLALRPRSTPLTEELLDWSDVIFYMQECNLKRLKRDFPSVPTEKCINITKFVDDPNLKEVKDPHFTGKHKEVVSQLFRCIDKIVSCYVNTSHPS